MKTTQKDKVLSMLKEFGEVSRNKLIDTRLTVRLSSIVHRLRLEGYDIETVEKESDTLYTMKPKTFKAYNILYPDGTKKLVTEPVWQ